MSLPESRRAIAGRTHSRTYYAADFDPVSHYPARNGMGGVMLATALGIVGAALMFCLL